MARTVTTLTEADNGKSIDVHAGDILVVRLHENASTGYRWALDEVASPLIAVHDAEYAGRSQAVGSPGEVQWRIEAKSPGTVRIALRLWRQWEGDSSIQKRFGVVLKISSRVRLLDS